jgi:chemotaxis protein CheZ
MREGLPELSPDKGIATAAEAKPDPRDRLACVARMSEQAAERMFNMFDLAQPLQDQLATRANGLVQRWDDWFSRPMPLDAARELVVDNRAYFAAVP